MRPWLVHLFCGFALCLPGLVVRAQLSEKMQQQIRETLPKFDPHAAEAKPSGPSVDKPAPLSDDDVIQMPIYHVFSPRAPGGDSDAWLTKEGVQKKALREYKNSLNALEWALNCFSIPFLTPSVQARADAAYAEKKLEAEAREFSQFVDAVSQIDPEAAKKLARDADLSRHPEN